MFINKPLLNHSNSIKTQTNFGWKNEPTELGLTRIYCRVINH